MAVFVRVMYLINGTDTKDVMLKISYVCSGPAPRREDKVLLAQSCQIGFTRWITEILKSATKSWKG